MSDHDLELLARVKADGRRRRLVVGTGVLAIVLLLGAIAVASIDDTRPQRVTVAAPGSQADDTADTTATTSFSDTTTTLQETTTTTKVELYAPSEPPREEVTTTTLPPTEPPLSTTVHKPSGLRFTLTTSAHSFRSSDDVSFTLVVRNDSSATRTYNSSPGPRFALLRNGQQAWHDGCETAYPAMFSTAEIAPGGEVTLAGGYPQTTPDPASRERCQQPPGDYSLTGIFQWCPNGDDECEDVAITPGSLQIVA